MTTAAPDGVLTAADLLFGSNEKAQEALTRHVMADGRAFARSLVHLPRVTREAAVREAAVAAAGLLICWAAAPALDAFAFGVDVAQSLGFSPARVRAALFVTTAMLAAVLVAASGAIGFVGLTVPHAARMLVGTRHRLLLPACAVLGATFLIWADTAARTVFAPQEIPVGVVTALIGVPAFAWLLRRRSAR